MAAADYRIEQNVAEELTQNWRNNNPLDELKAFSLSREAIEAILAVPNVANLKIYFGKDDNGTVKLVYTGSDANGKDILSNNRVSNIYDVAKPCPTYCDPTSPLNG